jgi:hypothetical protein
MTLNLKTFDIIGLGFNLNYKGEERFHSYLGGIFSILYILLSLGGVGYFGSLVLSRENPKVTFSNGFEVMPYLNFTGRLPIIAGFTDRGGVPIPDPYSYFNISFVRYQVDPSLKLPKKSLYQSGRCTAEDFQVDGENMTQSFLDAIAVKDFNYYQCLKQNQPLDVYGSLGKANFSIIFISFEKCQNTTDIICKPQAEIDVRVKNLFLNFLLPDVFFDSGNFPRVGNRFSKYFASTISSEAYKKFYIYYKNVEYTTDKGYLFSESQNEKFTQYQSHLMEMILAKEQFFTPSSFSEMLISTVQTKDLYVRSYYKLSDMVAELGGLMNVVIVTLTFINAFLNKSIFINEFYDTSFIYKRNSTEEKNKINSSRVQQSGFSREQVNLNRDKQHDEQLDVIIHNVQKDFHVLSKKQNTKTIQVTWRDAICTSKEKKNKIEFADKVINRFLDIHYLIKILNDVEAIKPVIFDKEQLRLFSEVTRHPHIEMGGKIEEDFDINTINQQHLIHGEIGKRLLNQYLDLNK